MIDSDGKTACQQWRANSRYRGDFQINSAGTEIVADPVVGAATGISFVVDLASMKVTKTYPDRSAPDRYGVLCRIAGRYYLQRHQSQLNIIGTPTAGEDHRPWAANRAVRPSWFSSAYGAAPNSIAVDAKRRCLRRSLHRQRRSG